MKIIYCFDAYCGWCFGFSPVITKLEETFRKLVDFEVLSGGMILPARPTPFTVTAPLLLENYPAIEAATGIRFGDDYLWHIKNPQDSDWYPNSEKPAIALCVFKDFLPHLQVQFATDLEYALHIEGRDLCDDEAYRHLLSTYNIPEEIFYKKLHEQPYRQMAHDEFNLVKHLQVKGFPCLLLQATESKFYLLASGYTDYESIAAKISSLVNQSHIT